MNFWVLISAHTMAIGDSDNHLYAQGGGSGCGHGSAPQEVRRGGCRDRLNMEDGAAIAIERYILGGQ